MYEDTVWPLHEHSVPSQVDRNRVALYLQFSSTAADALNNLLKSGRLLGV
jgi:hypothetical protein